MSISTPLESIANIIDLIGIFARPHPYFWTIHKKPWPSKGYASKLKISPYCEIFSALDKKMSFYEHLKEIWPEKMLFRKFTFPFRVRSVFQRNGRFFEFDLPLIGPRREISDLFDIDELFVCRPLLHNFFVALMSETRILWSAKRDWTFQNRRA